MPAAKLPFQDSLDDMLKGLVGKEALVPPPPEQSSAPLTGRMIKHMNDYEKLLNFHGLDASLVNGNFMAHCPFNECPEQYGDKEPKFSMHAQEGLFRCFRCGIKGNNYGFIREIHKLWFNRTTDADLLALAKMRHNSIDLPILKEMQLAFNGMTREWMLPAWATDGHDKGIVNLYLWRTMYDSSTGKEYRTIMSSPTMKHHLYGVHRLRQGTQRPIWVLEGHWDYLAFCSLLSRTNQSHNIDCIGAPGAATFPTTSLKLFDGRKIILAYDNDQPGHDGMESLLVKMNRVHCMPTSIEVINWPSDLSKGFDISDAMHKLPNKYAKKVK